MGVTDDVLVRAKALADAGVDAFVLDSAHGHSHNIMKSVEIVKNAFPQISLIAGNVATADATEALIKAGADAVKVGIGPAQSVLPVLLQVSVFRKLPLFTILPSVQISTAFLLLQTVVLSTAVKSLRLLQQAALA